MKKNVMMRVASIMLVLVLMSSSVISGTFAKYVTKGTATDTARVAKWGVKVTATNEMFSDSYKNEATTWTANETGAAITVQAKTEGTKVVAPGTEGKLANFVLEGTPEVDVKVTYVADLTLAGWVVDGVDYMPLTISVNGTPYTGATMAELETKVEAAINAYTNSYDTNVNLAAQTSNDLFVTWSWPYSTGDANDLKDTALGNADELATISLNVTCYVTQVD